MNNPLDDLPPLHPFYAKLFSYKLENLTRIQRGIGAIATVIHQMQLEKDLAPTLPPWWNDHVEGGLLDGIAALVSAAHRDLEHLTERVQHASREGTQ